MRNCNNIDKITKKSNEDPVTFDKKYLNIITVARPGQEKGHIRVLPGLKMLHDRGFLIKWFLVGVSKKNAPDEFLKKVDENNLDELIVFCGNQDNPYRFMKNADALLVPSIHEAAPMVFDEACILHLPVITTNTVSAIEMVRNSGIGYVCENSEEGIEKALFTITNKKDLLEEYRRNTYRCKISNSIPLAQFMALIGER